MLVMVVLEAKHDRTVSEFITSRQVSAQGSGCRFASQGFPLTLYMKCLAGGGIL